MAIFSAAFTAVVGFVSTTLGISVAAATTLTQVGVSLAISALTKPKQPTIPPQEVQANISQAAAARRRSYGKVLLGGVRAFFEAKDGVLHIIIVHNEGAASEILDFVIDGEKVVLDGSGVTTATGGRATGRNPTMWTCWPRSRQCGRQRTGSRGVSRHMRG